MANPNLIEGFVEFLEKCDGPVSSAANSLTAGKLTYTTADGATVALLAINGGAYRITIAADEADAVGMFTSVPLEPNECGLGLFKVRMRINTQITAVSIFVGLTDAITDTVVIEYEDATINTVATDAFGVLLESETLSGNWATTGVGNDVDDSATPAVSATPAIGATLADWFTVTIEFDQNGNAGDTVVRYRAWITDSDGNSVMIRTASTDGLGWTTSAARSSIPYYGVVSCDARNSAYTVDVAEVYLKGGIGTVFD